jgi:hypothetical protein
MRSGCSCSRMRVGMITRIDGDLLAGIGMAAFAHLASRMQLQLLAQHYDHHIVAIYKAAVNQG